ncbi:hypothetical protein LNQ03_27205 [Klebsiella pneumoniae subsp. pneumoniae]|nr:hypothetical protein [Klebsiella pneumoniae subsp. pneumoniae]
MTWHAAANLYRRLSAGLAWRPRRARRRKRCAGARFRQPASDAAGAVQVPDHGTIDPGYASRAPQPCSDARERRARKCLTGCE